MTLVFSFCSLLQAGWPQEAVMQLRLNIEGASSDEIAHGIAAAEAVFARAGISAEAAADGMFALEGWDIQGFPDDEQMSEEEDEAASVWMEANKAAIDACCACWLEKPGNYLMLELV
ncbi:hypothetical protein FJ930_27860 [Mesorhizobium sp. B2-4-15]|uniref:hypothetical protein n=1 Tax=Mesorhizobium sp. B2-4-15 TaxID=2589934 RepID=UPI00114DB83D|nr:hypothetical protein [Mesorhizobium sp. B2-4-15]TPK61149.1 hypothetical protein FJ930_27860 [Mesorhizobium sp. B2-4-15]